MILEVDQEIESFRGFESFGGCALLDHASFGQCENCGKQRETIILGGLISNTKDETDTGTVPPESSTKKALQAELKNNLRSELILMLVSS